MKLPILSLSLCLTFSAFTAMASQTPAEIEQTGKAAEAYLAEHPEKVGEAVATYLAEHPEFLVAAGENLRLRQQAAQQQAQVQTALHHREQLLNASRQESGPKEANAAVIVFIDNTSPSSHTAEEQVKRIAQSNPDIRFIYKAVSSENSGPTATPETQANLALAQQMGFTTLPAFIVMPQENDPEVRRVSVMSGNVSAEALIMAIQKAKK